MVVDYIDVWAAWLDQLDQKTRLPILTFGGLSPDLWGFSFAVRDLAFEWESTIEEIEVDHQTAVGTRSVEGFIYQKRSEHHQVPVLKVKAIETVLNGWQLTSEYSIEAIQQTQTTLTACQSCQHFSGKTLYSEVGDRRPMLVCGMHPYGPEAEACDDWEGKEITPPLISRDVLEGITLGSASPWVRGVTAEAMRRELAQIHSRHREAIAHHRLQPSPVNLPTLSSWAEHLGYCAEDAARSLRAFRAFYDAPLHPNSRCCTRWEYPFASNSKENHWRSDPLQIFGMREKQGKALRRAIARALKALSKLISP